MTSAEPGHVDEVLSRGREAVGGRHDARDRRRSRAKRLRQFATICAVAAAAAGAAWALRPEPVPVELAVARRAPLSLVIEESGVTRVKDRFIVSAPVSGSLSRLSFEAGDEVREGDALAELAPVSSPLLDERARAEAEARVDAAGAALGQAEAQVGRASAAHELARLDLERTRQLFRSGSLASQELERAEFTERMRTDELSSATFAQKVAKEDVRMARAALRPRGGEVGRDRRVEVRAPASGRVLRVHQKSAAVVQSGTPLVEVGNPQLLEVVVDLLTTDAVRVAAGTPVSISGWGGEPLSGRVRRVEPSGFTRPSALGVDEQRVNVIVTLIEPPERWSALGDGYRVEAKLVLWQGQSVLQVPSGAVFRRGQSWAAFRIRQGLAQLVELQIGHRGERSVEIVEGLAAGDQVVVHPGERVDNGARVAPSSH